MGRIAQGGSHHFIINNQYPKIITSYKALYNNLTGYARGKLISGNSIFNGLYVNAYTTAVITIKWFKYQREAYFPYSLNHLFGAVNGHALSNRNGLLLQQTFSLVFVTG